ncbi:chaperone protein DnaJ-like isoform X2 [Juglans microcarpa x Juglans regia]|uniref:chaperone protein DnaJ-like isoform X2 n=1 Tax=Juglans microcarpa x Juglans regia TaxID=2249226 RepID=UPI001B7F35A4|nr:chaperone protein DnaJ-like isoform X2 [Juglans microcarpa x Juglans regia]
MHGLALPLTPPHNLCFSHLCSRSLAHPWLLSLQNQPKPSIRIPRFWNYKQKTRTTRITPLRASLRESPYEVLGLSPSATLDEIKRAYRKLALKNHPDVNKEANAQEKFMRIKHAYNTLLNSQSRRKYDTRNDGSDYSYSRAQTSQSRKTHDEEEFYGFEDFFRDLQEEFQNWEASAASQGKPKSLWEELAEIGEEFVEFLEKELNITDQEAEVYDGTQTGSSFRTSGTQRTGSGGDDKASEGSNIEKNIDDIEATLAQLKKELGL